MYISKRDFDIFRLLRWCRYVSKSSLENIFSPDEINCLIRLKIMTHHSSSDSIVLTKRGNQFLDLLDDSLPQNIQPAYRATDTLRRVRRSRMMLTFYEAGLPIFHMHPAEIGDKDGFCLSSITKGQGTNLWGNSRIAGIMSIGHTAFAVHYVCPNIGRITMLNELNTLSIGASSLGKPRLAFIYVGDTYEEVMEELTITYPQPTKSKKKQTRIYYKDAFNQSTKSIHLLTCGTLGALQLKIMQAPDHYTRLAMSALGDAYQSPTPDDECDAFYSMDTVKVSVERKGNSYVIRDSERKTLNNIYLEMLKKLGLSHTKATGVEAQLTPVMGEAPPQQPAPQQQPQQRQPAQQRNNPPMQNAPVQQGNIKPFPAQPPYQYIVTGMQLQNGMHGTSTALEITTPNGNKLEVYYNGLMQGVTNGTWLTDVQYSTRTQSSVVYYVLERYRVVPPNYQQAA